MNNQNYILQDYMGELEIDLRKDKIKEFLRFIETPKYFKLDTEQEVANTKNIWAGYAYLTLLDKINGKELSQVEETYINRYYNEYLTSHELNKYELETDGFFVKYRLSKDFDKNGKLSIPIDVNSNEFKEGAEEFALTLQSMLSIMYSKYPNCQNHIKVKVNKSQVTPVICKGNTINISGFKIVGTYKSFIENDCDIHCVLDLIKDISNIIALDELNDVKQNQISKEAVIYTIEDYLQSKTLKKTKLANVYAKLYRNIIANKQIIIDSSRKTANTLEKLHSILIDSNYGNFNNQFEDYLRLYDEDVYGMNHYYKDANYFDTNNLENDAISKLYDMYIKGLKAMPKSKLTNVTKYFALNGDALSSVEMNTIIDNYLSKIKNAKSEEKKESIRSEMNKVKEVMEFVKGLSYSYTIEDAMINKDGNYDLTDILNMIINNYSEYEDAKYRLSRAYSNLDDFASSGSPTKVAGILSKKRELETVLGRCEMFDSFIRREESLKSKIYNVDPNKDIVVRRVKDYNRVISLLQELTGKGIVTTSKRLDASIEEGAPLIKNLAPGFKQFVEESLTLKGVQDFKKTKKRK